MLAKKNNIKKEDKQIINRKVIVIVRVRRIAYQTIPIILFKFKKDFNKN